MCDNFIGAQVRIVTKCEQEYLGTLVKFDSETSSTVLENVRWFKSESDRKKLNVTGSFDMIIQTQIIPNKDISSLNIVLEAKANNSSSFPHSNLSTHPDSLATASSANKSSDHEASKPTETFNDSQALTFDAEKQIEMPIGTFCTYPQSIQGLFDDTFDSISLVSSSNSITSSSSCKSSKGKSNQKEKPRPCMVWNTSPNLQVFVTSRFDKDDLRDPNVKLSTRLSFDYIRKRLVPIHPKQSVNEKRCIFTQSSTASPATIIDTYLILIPVTIKKEKQKKLKPTSEFISNDDLMYINDVVRQIGLDEHNEKADMIQAIDRSSILNNDDVGSSASSLPITRQLPVEENILSNEQQISTWISKSFVDRRTIESRPSSPLSFTLDLPTDGMQYHDHSGDSYEEKIFLINETGEDLRVFHWKNFEIDRQKSLVSSSLIAHEWMSVVVGNNHRLEGKSWNVGDRFVQGQKEIRFQIRHVVKIIDLSKACKRVFSIDSSSGMDSRIHVVCDVQVRNNHIHVIFSSIAKIINRTPLPLFIKMNDSKLYQRKEKIDVDDEYHVPFSFFDEKSILIGFDKIEMDDYLNLEWKKEFPVEKTFYLTNGDEAKLIVKKEFHQCLTETDLPSQICFSMLVDLFTNVI